MVEHENELHEAGAAEIVGATTTTTEESDHLCVEGGLPEGTLVPSGARTYASKRVSESHLSKHASERVVTPSPPALTD